MAGRPRTIPTPEEFQARVEAYFASDAGKATPTLSGMALEIGLWGIDALREYESYEGFSDTVKKAKARVMQRHEERLFGTTPTGSIFWLKNAGWKDNQDVNIGNQGGEAFKQEWTVTIARPKPAGEA